MQVESETARRHVAEKVSIRRGDNPHVERNAPVVPNRDHRSVLDHPQQLSLKVQTQLAVVRREKWFRHPQRRSAAQRIAIGSRKRSLDMPKQLVNGLAGMEVQSTTTDGPSDRRLC